MSDGRAIPGGVEHAGDFCEISLSLLATPPLHPDAMAFIIKSHDSWGIVKVADFQSIEEAKRVFSTLCEDPWYQRDGVVKGVELVQENKLGADVRIAWFAFK